MSRSHAKCWCYPSLAETPELHHPTGERVQNISHTAQRASSLHTDTCEIWNLTDPVWNSLSRVFSSIKELPACIYLNVRVIQSCSITYKSKQKFLLFLCDQPKWIASSGPAPAQPHCTSSCSTMCLIRAATRSRSTLSSSIISRASTVLAEYLQQGRHPWNNKARALLLPGSVRKEMLLPWNSTARALLLPSSEWAPSHEPTSTELSSLSNSCTSKVLPALSSVWLLSVQNNLRITMSWLDCLWSTYMTSPSPQWERDWQFVFR